MINCNDINCFYFCLQTGTDDEAVILNAFAQYDEGDGKCNEDT